MVRSRRGWEVGQGERIGAGKEVADVAVAVKEGLHPRLFQGLGRIDSTRPPLAAEGKALEKRPPVGGELPRIGLPQTILCVDPLRREIIGNAHGGRLGGEGRENGAATGSAGLV